MVPVEQGPSAGEKALEEMSAMEPERSQVVRAEACAGSSSSVVALVQTSQRRGNIAANISV